MIINVKNSDVDEDIESSKGPQEIFYFVIMKMCFDHWEANEIHSIQCC